MSLRHRVRRMLHPRSLALNLAALVAAAAMASAANAAVQITIDKDTQRMSVAVDGVQRYSWPVSSGVPAHETPNGSFKAFRMEADHYSKEWDDAPMPHSIFFTKAGHAIHGTDSVKRLGTPASHGCVRLSRENAAVLYDLVERQGVLNTTVTLTGSSQVALARGGNRIARDDSGESAARAQRARSYDGTQAGAQVYVDAWGRPVQVYRSPDDAYAQRRVYQQRQYYADDSNPYYYSRPRGGYYYYGQQ